jgi:hypothetical protein
VIEAKLNDPWREVVWIEAMLPATGKKFDLFDTGDRGDRVARDGVWSFGLLIETYAESTAQRPPSQPEPKKSGARRYRVEIVAYDKNGHEVKVEDKSGERVPLTTEMSFEVSR